MLYSFSFHTQIFIKNSTFFLIERYFYSKMLYNFNEGEKKFYNKYVSL
jgi:hypothetical protein